MTLGLLGLAMTAQGADVARRHALLVGANDGGHERTILQYAHRDAEAMDEVLVRLGGVDAPDSEILLDPGVAALEQAITDLEQRISSAPGERSEVIFYYSGHSDEEGLLLGEERFFYPDLRKRLEALSADVKLAILDSCASGAMIRAKGGRKVAPFLVGESNQVGGFAYITSSSADEVAQEAERIGGSYFTHYLATGLRGAADQSEDGRVTLDEAYSFAYAETLARTERTQHGPQHATREMNIFGKGELVLTDLKLTTASLVLEDDLAGRVLVRTDGGDLQAELVLEGGRAVELALGEGDYEVTWTIPDDPRYAVANVTLESGASTLLASADLTWFDSEGTVARGGSDEPVASELSNETKHEKNGMRFHTGLFHPRDGRDRMVGGLVTESQELNGIALGFVSTTTTEDAGGIQASLGWNRSGGDGAHLQAAIGMNWAGEDQEGFQTAAFNHAGHSRGLQGAYGVNHAGELTGVQLAPVNIAGDVHAGVQLGLVNVGKDVDGVQIGLVNVANSSKVPIGLVSIIKEGRHDVLISASETSPVNVDFKFGGAMHTRIGFGTMPGRHLSFDFGVGAHAAPGKVVWMDFDLVGSAYADQAGVFDRPPTYVASAEYTLGFQIAREFAVFGGIGMNVRVPNGQPGRLVDMAPGWASEDAELQVWPGFFGGVQF